ncbi:radical SAM protein [Pseudorhodoferax sp. Leaf274]|uniref:radical SAM protein n=1 Tax=Pseudorhodoferax sp. Leaf274 TaxID=1736318 RepID=UPI00138F990E|nr:radical SAM protein [Pseudorhodoferax sp. Leaf274]
MPTWQCNASCSNCGTLSHPKNKVALEPALITYAIDQAKRDNIAVVVFTGGEATLKPSVLLDAIRQATELGISTRLVTNAWWAKSNYAATKMLAQLKSAGLKEINFSTGDEHAKFIPVSCVANAIVASVEHGFHAYVMVELVATASITKESVVHELEKLNFHSDDKSVSFIESPWTPLDPSAIGNYADGVCANKSNLPQRTGCDSIYSTPTLQADGTLAICCGIGMQKVKDLQLGQLAQDGTSLGELCESAELDIVKLLIKHFGPEKTLAMTSDFREDIVWEDMYAHKCQACIRIFSDSNVLNEIRSRESYFMAKLAASMGIERILEAAFDE